MKKQNMVYSDPIAVKHGAKLLYKGKYKNVNYAVVNMCGGWMTAYVEVTGTKYDESSLYNSFKSRGRARFPMNSKRKRYHNAQNDFDDVVHEGITYGGPWCVGICNVGSLSEDAKRWFIGWDYGHFSDYVWHSAEYEKLLKPLQAGLNKKKWTVDEGIAECKACINKLLKLTEKNA